MKKRISSKIILTVAIILLVVMTASMLTACSKTPHFELSEKDWGYGDKAFENMKYLAENYPDRTMGTPGEERFAKYLSTLLSGWGYTSDFSDAETLAIRRIRCFGYKRVQRSVYKKIRKFQRGNNSFRAV